MLIKFDTKANNNKFYELRYDERDPSALGTITIRYGRVGSKGAISKKTGGRRNYETLLRQKKNKGYREAMLKATIESTSDNGNTINCKKNAMDIALEQIVYKDDESKHLIEALSVENIHNITSNTNIEFDSVDGLFKTPLGVISKEGVNKAVDILNEIKPLLDDIIKNEEKLSDLNNEYYFIIPNKVKNARDQETLIYNLNNWTCQMNICNALYDTLKLLEDLEKNPKIPDPKETSSSKEEVEKLFDVEIEHINDKSIIDEISKKYQESKASNHQYNGIPESKVTNIYKVALKSQQEPFLKCSNEISNVMTLWHGTRTANLLSILSKGLLLPSQSPGQKAGALFGHGLYFANKSTKSLQYCDGLYWAQNSTKKPHVYLFLASVAIGNPFYPTTARSSKPPKGYDSYWALADKAGVINDELIVFKGCQVRLDYLVEVSL